MGTYVELTDAGVTTRAAARLTGLSRATASRAGKPSTGPDPTPRTVVPANRLSLAERTRILEVLDSAEFVDQAPLQVYATLLERGQYLCSISSIYRILAQAGQVTERRRLEPLEARMDFNLTEVPAGFKERVEELCNARPHGSSAPPVEERSTTDRSR